MIVEIKQITVEGDDIFLLIRCRNPYQKETPWLKWIENLDGHDELFQKDAEQQMRELNEYKKRVLQLHLGAAILTQDGK
jgi:hypothetical protein